MKISAKPILGVLLSRSITLPLGVGVRLAGAISPGDLRQEVEPRWQARKDEIGELTRALNAMVLGLREVALSVRSSADNVSQGSTEISNTAQTLSQRSSEQASAAEEVGASAEERGSSIKQSAENSLAAEAKAQTRAKDAKRGGEAGKGFAVVASEVRKLAEQLAEALCFFRLPGAEREECRDPEDAGTRAAPPRPAPAPALLAEPTPRAGAGFPGLSREGPGGYNGTLTMKRLTIGELSSLLGIPPSTLRFYESKDLVRPEKHYATSYRGYTAHESCRFLTIKRLQSLGLSLKEANVASEAGDALAMEEVLGDQARVLEAEAARIEAARRSLARLRDDWALLEGLSPGSGIATSKELRHGAIEARDCLFTRSSGAYLRDAERRRLAREWIKALPGLTYICQINPDGFLGQAPPSCSWGYALPAGTGPGKGSPWVETQASAPSLCLGLLRSRSIDFTEEELRGPRDAFLATGRGLAGPVTATFLGTLGPPGNEAFAYRVDIPVKS